MKIIFRLDMGGDRSLNNPPNDSVIGCFKTLTRLA